MGGSRCVVGGCTNRRTEQISLHQFPKDAHLRAQWVRAIKGTGTNVSRANWNGPNLTKCAQAQLVCSEHFEETCFTLTTRMHRQQGLPYKAALNDDAVPTLFGTQIQEYRNKCSKSMRGAFRKRELGRIINKYEKKSENAGNAHHLAPAQPEIPQPSSDQAEGVLTTKMPRKKKGRVSGLQRKNSFCRPPVASAYFQNLQEEKTEEIQPFIEIVNDCNVVPPYEEMFCKVKPANEEIVCKVEPADEELDYRIELAQEEIDIKVEPAFEEINTEVQPAFKEIDIKVEPLDELDIKVEPVDEEIDYRIELAHEEIDIKVEPAFEEINTKVQPAFKEIDIKVEPIDELDIKVEPVDEEIDYRIELAHEEIDIKSEPSDEQSKQTEAVFRTPQRKSKETVDASVQAIESENDHNYAKNFSDNACDVDSMDKDISQSNTRNVYVYFASAELDEVTVDNPVDIGEVEVTVESLSFKKFSSAIKENLNGKYSVYETNSGLTLIEFYNMNNAPPAVKLTVKFDSRFECHVSVHGKEIPRSHSLWTDAPEFFHDVESALKLLKRLDNYTVCCGNPEIEFHELVTIGSDQHISNSVDTINGAVREGDFGAFTANGKPYNCTIRSKFCELLTISNNYTQNDCQKKKEKCWKCKFYEFRLRRKKKCLEKRKENPKKFISSCLSHKAMTREELCYKLNEQKVEINNLKKTIKNLKYKVAKFSRKDSVIMQEGKIGKLKREVARSSRKDGVIIQEGKINKLKPELAKSCQKDGVIMQEHKIGKLKREPGKSSRKVGVNMKEHKISKLKPVLLVGKSVKKMVLL